MTEITAELSPAGMRELRRTLRCLGASRGFSGWAIADLLLMRPEFVEIKLPAGRELRVKLTDHPVKFPSLSS